MKNTLIQNGNNMPIQAPLIPEPFVPYECKGNTTLSAICRVKESVIKSLLEPTPFEYVSNYMIVSISDFSNCDKVAFMDCALVIPVKYKNMVGGYYLFEYENNDSAIAAGRDLWGYPKKYAEITLVRKGNVYKGKAVKNGVAIVDIECDLDESVLDLPEINTTPHLNIHMVPNSEGPGIFSKRIIARDTSPDFQLQQKKLGTARVSLKGNNTEPLDLFEEIEVIGGSITIGDFYATKENGWGKVLEILK